MKKISLLVVLFYSIASFSQDITGEWYGKISVMGSELRLSFTISKNENVYSGTMSVPQQNANGIPLSSVTFQDNLLKITFDAAGFSYAGKLNAETVFEGTFSQNGQNFPLNLSREKMEETKLNRPQEPKGKFDYGIEEVTFENKKDKITLAGTLTYPQNNKPYPVVVLISGSGPQDRNSEIFGHKSFWVIADYLTKNGIGVLRFDDRGVAKSQGDRSLATSYDFATDVEAAVAFLKTKSGVDSKKIGLIGHSEGGMIAPIVASKDKTIDFIILLAGPGIPCMELLLDQAYQIGKVAGMTEEQLSETRKINQSIYTIVKSDADDETVKKELTTILEKITNENSQLEQLSESDKKQMIAQQIEQLSSPWYRSFMKFNPSIYLEKVKCPVLALNGEKDLQVPSNANTEGIKNSLSKGGNKKVTLKVYPNLNHLFQECETGAVEEYGTIEQTFSPTVLTDIKDWILLQTK